MIIIGGQPFELPSVKSKSFEETRLQYSEKNTADRRVRDPRWVVLHWTASERIGDKGARIIFDSLKNRRLSVEFFIDNDGTIYQFADPADVSCRHASSLNKLSIGVEVSGVGYDKPGRKVSEATAARRRYQATFTGWKPWLRDYLPAQHAAVHELAELLIVQMSIPRRVELEPFERRTHKYLVDSLGGFCGHCHCASWKVANPKIDPGPAPLIALASAFDGEPS